MNNRLLELVRRRVSSPVGYEFRNAEEGGQ
jgi:hypothetical protein